MSFSALIIVVGWVVLPLLLTFRSYTQVGFLALNFIRITELGFSTSLSQKH